jgi:hypothetical protein
MVTTLRRTPVFVSDSQRLFEFPWERFFLKAVQVPMAVFGG